MPAPRVGGHPGERYGRLVVIEEAPKRNKHRYVLCRCDCGTMVEVRLRNLRKKIDATRSCGCARSVGRLVHGMSKTRLYKVWVSMIGRCHNPANTAFHNYGGRGIAVCDEWRENFTAFYEHIGPPPGEGYTLDRIDNDGDYEPGNVRWATRKEQSMNKRCNNILKFDGREQPLTAWAEEYGLSIGTLRSRLSNGWPIKKALTTPPLPSSYNPSTRFLKFDGREQSLIAWSREFEIAESTLRNRLNRGLSVEEALTVPASRGTIYLEFEGQRKTIAEWAKEAGLSKAGLSGRLRRGWSVEKALTTPLPQRLED